MVLELDMKPELHVARLLLGEETAPSTDLLLAMPQAPDARIELSPDALKKYYIVLYPWGIEVNPDTEEQSVGGTDAENSIPVGNGNRKLEVVLGIYRVRALKALDDRGMLGEKGLIPSGDFVAVFEDSGNTQKYLNVSWSQSYEQLLQSLKLKIKMKIRPESSDTRGEMALTLEEIALYKRKNVLCITDWAQGIRQVTFLLLYLHNHPYESAWIKKATKKSLDLITTHPAWLYFSYPPNIVKLFTYIDEVEPEYEKNASLKKRLILLHRVALNPRQLFINDHAKLHEISVQYQTNMSNRERHKIWGEEVPQEIIEEKRLEPNWFADVITPEVLDRISRIDPKIKFISSPEILRKYDPDGYRELQNLMETGPGQMTVAQNLIGAIEIFLGIYYSVDEEYNNGVRDGFIQTATKYAARETTVYRYGYT